MTSATKTKSSAKGFGTFIAIALVVLLFFIWGLTMNLTNGLNAPMQNYLQLSPVQSSLLQVAYYGAYFVMAIPASMLARRFGYKGGVIAGLLLFLIGSLVTVPATNYASFAIFLIAMFVIAAGSATLETNCNPYITKLGDADHEEMRINLAQGFNGIGFTVGPLILGQILNQTIAPGAPGFNEAKLSFLTNIQMMYIVVAVVVAIVLLIFLFIKLPTPQADEDASNKQEMTLKEMVKYPHFTLGVLAQFIFIGLQVVGLALFSNFALQQWQGIDGGMAATLLAILSLVFTIGRFVTTPILARVKGGKVLGIYMICAGVLMVLVFLGLGPVSVISYIAAFFFVSVGYPIIFSLTLKGFGGSAAKLGASILVMSIVGAALIPFLLSAVAEYSSIGMAMLLTIPGFIYIAWYALKGSTLKPKSS